MHFRLSPSRSSLPSQLDQNALVLMAEVNGFLVDLLDMPREVQQIAFDEGAIPYIPADQETPPKKPSLTLSPRQTFSNTLSDI